MDEWFSEEGSPSPLGVSWVEQENSYNFALYSKHATHVTLLLYSEVDEDHPLQEIPLNPLLNKSGRVWHCRLHAAKISAARYYAYQIDGPNEPGDEHRFDRDKILLDPYARAVHFPKRFSRAAACQPGSNAGRAPLGIIRAPHVYEWHGEHHPVHTHDTVAYELHVRGFTARENSGVAAAKRGTFAGLIDYIPYLRDLGVTVVELMPVTQQDPQQGSYWGYMPLSLFAPEFRYSSASRPELALDEFHDMVLAFHAADIEVLVDVVFNHTTEGDETGPTYSYRGIDNSTYYLLQDDRRFYRNDTGTGNTLNCPNRYVRKMIIDCLHFWLEEMHVDGFRFDLASIFTRNRDGTLNTLDPPVVAEITGLPESGRARLVAEAWDPASYQLGRTFPGISWLQWNGQFRDCVRAYLRGDGGKVPDLMTRLYGSSDLFPDDLLNAYRPYQSVNYVSSHDGLCLNDVVSFNSKHNEANGENNLDGPSENLSWNCGWEGLDAPEEVIELRKKQAKNFCALLFLSNGTPMILAGDEFMNTRQGNNNPYNQDNEVNWLDWSLLEKNRDVHRFFRQMIAFRKMHRSIARSHFWREDVRWYGVGDRPDLAPDSHSLAFCLHGTSCRDNDIYVMSNAWSEPLEFRIQEGLPGEWYRVADTSLASPLDFLEVNQEERLNTLSYRVAARSTVILLRK